MRFNFFNVFKYVLFRKASNAIINKGIDSASHLKDNNIDNGDYNTPSLKTVFKTLFFTGWLLSLGYLVWSAFFLVFRLYTWNYIFSGLVVLIVLYQFFENKVYKNKQEPIYAKDLRYKSGQKLTGYKTVKDKASEMPMPKAGRIYRNISVTISLCYLLGLGFTADYYIIKFFKDSDAKATHKIENTVSGKDTLKSE